MENVAVESPVFKVIVVYNGTPKDETVPPHELVGTLLQRALQAFHVRDRQHAYGLFKAAVGGSPIPDALTVRAAGIQPQETLYLREKQVQGG